MNDTQKNILTFTSNPTWGSKEPYYPLTRLLLDDLLIEEEIDEALSAIRQEGFRKPSWEGKTRGAGRAGSSFFTSSSGRWPDALQLVGTVKNYGVYQDPVVPDTLWVFETGKPPRGRMPSCLFSYKEGELFMALPFMEGYEDFQKVSMV